MSSTPATADLRRIVRDPAWLAHRYDPAQDAIHFVRLARDAHRTAPFLTDEYLPADAQRLVIRRTDAMVAAPVAAPLHLILHSAFCCSTLLARALDVDGLATGLKEPVILNDLVGWKRRGAARPHGGCPRPDARAARPPLWSR